MDDGTEAEAAAVFVQEGTANADNSFTQTVDGVTIGTTAQTWVQFNGLGQVTAGQGLTKTGNTLDVGAGTGITVNADDVAIDFSTAFNDQKAVAAQDLNSTTNGEGASIIGIEDASSYYTGTNAEAAFNELEAQIGGTTSSTFAFTEDNVLADNDAIYAALDKLDLKHGDYASTANGEGASLIAIEDSAGNFTATDVEAALAELASDIDAAGVDYTVGTGGVSKGDLCYISSNNTILPYSTLTQSHRGIGLALTTEAATATVKVLANDTVITSILTAATAGDPYYWDGSTLTTTIPTTAAAYVWQAGVAKNATDLHVEVRLVKKNA